MKALFDLWKFYDLKYLPQKSAKRSVLWAILFTTSAGVFYKFISPKDARSKEEVVTVTKATKKPKVAVDKVFFRRLKQIFKIIFPSLKSREFLHLAVLTVLLLARSMLSIKVADVTGKNAQYLVQRRWSDTVWGIIWFAAIGIPASCVNSLLRYETSSLSLNFRKRLSMRIHEEYLQGVNFYKASHLGGENKIDNADQRVTADIEKFSEALSNLYTTIFKPVLDVILFTHKLSGLMGIRGPLLLFAYYGLSGVIKRFLMPAFGKLTARESELEGDYRTAHQRLITNAEEIAFYDGSKKERTIINSLFHEIYTHSSYVYWLKALVGIFDNFLLKYGTSVTGYIILALPVYFPSEGAKAQSVSELTQDYVRNRQLLINLAGAVAQLVVLSNKITTLAGLTARVSELLEMVQQLDKVGSKPFTVIQDPSDASTSSNKAEKEPISGVAKNQEMEKWLLEWKEKGELLLEIKEKLAADSPVQKQNGGGNFIEGKFIKFENVDIVSPDGKILVENLSFEVKRNQNVMVTGPNGSGKSSLFRILGELWPLHNGTLVKPRKEHILFVPQKPYLVLGTLRDQIIYPHSLDDMKKQNITDDDLEKLMEIVDPARTILGQWKWNEKRDWLNTFSGGQKQRVAMARLFYHRPLFAILDECTSAVSDEVEGRIYETCKALGITLFTVSHRPQLKKYHDYVLKFQGSNGKWEWSSIAKDQ